MDFILKKNKTLCFKKIIFVIKYLAMQNFFLKFILMFSVICFGQIKDTSKEFQDNLNQTYRIKKESPLTDQDFATFKSLDFFEIDSKFIVEAQFIKAADEKVFEMKTTTIRLPKYKKFGELEFKIEGVAFKLTVYQNIDLMKIEGYEDYLFFTFYGFDLW